MTATFDREHGVEVARAYQKIRVHPPSARLPPTPSKVVNAIEGLAGSVADKEVHRLAECRSTVLPTVRVLTLIGWPDRRIWRGRAASSAKSASWSGTGHRQDDSSVPGSNIKVLSQRDPSLCLLGHCNSLPGSCTVSGSQGDARDAASYSESPAMLERREREREIAALSMVPGTTP